MRQSIEQTFSVCPVCRLGFTRIEYYDDVRDVFRVFVHAAGECKILMRESVASRMMRGPIDRVLPI